MSYILDALRKADAQRERDPARGIHAQPVPAVGASATQRLAGTKPFWIGGGLVAALLLTAGWYVSRSDPVQRALVVAANSPASAPATVTAPPVAVANQAPASVQPPANIDLGPGQRPARGLLRTQPAQNDPAMGMPRTARGAAAAGGAVPAPAPASAPSMASAPSATPPAPLTAPAPFIAPSPSVAPSTSGAPASVVAAVPTPAAVPAAASSAATGLPPDAPKIAISGGVYSASPAQRLLIVNGQVFNEGSEVAPGVTVEEINARTAVLKFKGMRYTMAY